MGQLRSTAAAPPSEFATLQLGSIIQHSRLGTDFLDQIDGEAVSDLTTSIDGLDLFELVGRISRPDGDVRWDPVPAFARLGVQPIHFAKDELSMVTQPGPTSSSRVFTVVLKPFEPLSFELKDVEGLE